MAAQVPLLDTGGDPTEMNPVKIAGEGRDGSEYIDPEEDSSESLTYGFHDTWVNGFEKELASSTAGSVDPTVREQGAGGHDSWVSNSLNRSPVIRLRYPVLVKMEVMLRVPSENRQLSRQTRSMVKCATEHLMQNRMS